MPPRNTPSQGEPRDETLDAPPAGAPVDPSEPPTPANEAELEQLEQPAPPAAQPAVPEPQAQEITSDPTLDEAPYAEQYEPGGWDPPEGRPPLGELAETNANQES